MVSVGIALSQDKVCGFISFDSCNIIVDPFQGPIDTLGVTLNDHLIHNLHWLYIDVILLTKPISSETLTSTTKGYDTKYITIIGTRFIIDISNIQLEFKNIIKLSFEESYKIEFEQVSKRIAKYYFLSAPLVLEFVPHSSGYSLGAAWYMLKNPEKSETIAILTPICESNLFKMPSIETLCQSNIILYLVNNKMKIKNENQKDEIKFSNNKNYTLNLLKNCENKPLNVFETDIFSPSLLYFLVDYFNNYFKKYNKNIFILDCYVKKFFNLLNQSCEWTCATRSESTMNTNPQPPFHDITHHIGSNLFLCENNAELNRLLSGTCILIKHNESIDLFKELIPPPLTLNFDESQKIYSPDNIDAKLEDILPEWYPGNFVKVSNKYEFKKKKLVNASISIRSDPLTIDYTEALNWGLYYRITNIHKLAKALGGKPDLKRSKVILDNCVVTIHSPNVVEIESKDIKLRRKITKIIEKFH